MLSKKIKCYFLFVVSLFLCFPTFPLFASSVEEPNSFRNIVSLGSAFIIIYLLFMISQLRNLSLTTEAPLYPSQAGVAIVLCIGILLRFILAIKYIGHPTDMSCWAGWASGMAEHGPLRFYESMDFADYPPGYMLILWPIGELLDLLPFSYGSIPYSIILKLPILIFDLGTIALVYKIAKEECSKTPILLMALFFLNPALIFISAAWGQVDIILCFFVIMMLMGFYEENLQMASLAFVGGLLIKPQMLLFGPIFIIGFIYFCHERGVREILETTLMTAFFSIVAFLIICLPFLMTKSDPLWLIKLYFSTMGSYPYASVNGINLMSLINGLWANDTDTFLGISYYLIGTLGIIISIGYTFYLALRQDNRKYLAFYAALMLMGIFTLGHHMHERYMFPAIICLFIAYLYVPKNITLYFATYFTALQTLNMTLVLKNTFLYSSMPVVRILSCLQVLGYIALCVYAYIISKESSLTCNE